MKKQITLCIIILGLFMNCLVPFSDTETDTNDGSIVTWLFIWGTINSANSSRSNSSTTSSSTCLYSNVVFPTTSCENSEVLAQNGCKLDSITKGTIKYYRYSASVSETLSMVVDPSLPSDFTNCIAAYKENKLVTTNSPISDLETNQSTSSCQRNTSVSMTAGSYRCISVHSLCTGTYTIKLSNAADLPTSVTPGGTATTTLPSAWAAATTTYTPITSSPAPIIGDDAFTILPIGFTFTYFGQTYSTLYVTANGFLTFNSSNQTSANPSNLFGTILKSVIAPWWGDLYLDCDASIQYITTGTAPNRVFTAQWQNIRNDGDTASTTQRLNFQVKLYETTNVVELIYGANTGTALSTSSRAAIGISNSVGGTGNYVNGKTGLSTDTNLYSSSSFPISGTVYRFTP
ncbi:MAG: hypothetical protein KBF99_05510 [Leptospiraceae bacterium]|nr:hypothetical protein [Leptospiraceae bacterium]MBL0265170.1 hypothetical protein [Leptospiraceae bacterium]MBP9162617.1 hypothetical protein [Leptospiraceae bacterium]